jgi:hypothetical protein
MSIRKSVYTPFVKGLQGVVRQGKIEGKKKGGGG